MAGMPMNVAVLWDALRRDAGVELRSADITPEKLGAFLIEIRSQGAAAAQQQHVTLQGEYATAYAQYMQLQDELDPLEKAKETLLNKVDDQLRRVMEQAAKYKLQGRKQRMSVASQDQSAAAAYTEHPKYTSTVAGLSAQHREWVDRIIFPCYLLRWQVEEAENALWVKYTGVSIAQETYQLWTYEMQGAQMQMGQMEEEFDADAYRAQLQRHFLEKRLEEIRLQNKERKKRVRKERLLENQAPEHSTTGASPSHGKGSEKRHRPQGRSEETAGHAGSRVPASSKHRSAVCADKKREGVRQSRRASSASPRTGRTSGAKREHKIDPSAWL